MENLREKVLEIVNRKGNYTDSMIKYFNSKFFNAIELKDGIIDFDKPSIEKHYCYSYDEHQSGSYEFASQCCKSVRNNFDAFLRINLKDIDRRINTFEEKIEEGNSDYEKVWIIDRHWDAQEKEKMLKNWTIENDDEIKARFDGKCSYRVAEVEELEKILKVYKEMREYMIKKCKTYWKRYGGTKLRTWTYSVWD